MWFFKKQKVDFTESERLHKLEVRMNLYEAEIMDLQVAQNILKDKILKKIQIRKEETKENPKDLYGGMLIPV